MTETDNDTQRQNGVAAVDRALSIVAALASGTTSLSLSELSRGTQLYKSTILRLLESLERAQYVTRLPDTRYTLGPMAYRLGMAYERTNDVAVHVIPVLEELVAAGTESASFHIPYGEDRRLCLLRKDSNHSTLDSVRAGQILPLIGAAGKIVQTCLNQNTVTAISQIRVVASYGERDPSCAGIASAVVGADGRLIGALSLSGPIGRFTPESVAKMSPRLLASAQRISQKLGGNIGQ